MHGLGRDRRAFRRQWRNFALSNADAWRRLSKACDAGDLSFVQISDSHIGFSKEANKDVLFHASSSHRQDQRLADSARIHSSHWRLSHLSKPEEFDALDQLLKSVRTEKFFYVPGEHDVLTDNGAIYLERYGKGTKGAGWQSFDVQGVHFIGLVNVLNLKAGGLGNLGREQLEWLEDDVKDLSSSTPIVVFAHIPLWTVYPEWGWGTDDSEQALSYLKRFGSVTVSTVIFIRHCKRLKETSISIPLCPQPFPNRLPGWQRRPVR